MAKRLITPEDLLRLTLVGDTTFSSDGRRVLMSVQTFGEKFKPVSHLHTVDPETLALKQWTAGAKGAGQGRFSPSGGQISFLSKREGPGAQIHLISAEGGEARPLTKLPEGSLAWHLWSPDGESILFCFRETAPERTEAAKKRREEEGRSAPPWEVETAWWRLDGDGVFGQSRFKLYLADLSGDHKLVFENAFGSYACTWLPDSSGFIVIGDPREKPWFGMPSDEIFVVSHKGKAKKIKTGIPGSKSTPRISPDGKLLAWIGDDSAEGWGVNNARIWISNMDGSDARCLTRESDEDFEVGTLSDANPGHTSDGGGCGFMEWSPDGKSLYASIGRRGSVHLAKVDAQTGAIELLTEPGQCWIPGALSPDGTKIAGIRGTATAPFEAALFDLEAGTSKDLTSLNHWVDKELSLSAPEELEVTAEDGSKVHTWIMLPPGDKGRKKLPAILEVHGGPHAQYGFAFFHEFQVLAAEGRIVVFSNPRGSKGYGEAWTKAIHRSWGVKDWEDIRAVMDWMKAHPRIDSEAMGVMGGSYGGWMTNWVIGHSHDFRAAITDRCVSNMVSFSGNSDFPMNDRDYFGGIAYGSLEKIAPLWQQSPIAFFEGVKTPTLIIHSEGDMRCNIEQSEQVFLALQAQGVESRFVRYPATTSHGMSRNGPPDLRLHRLGEIVRWWRRWLD